MPEIQIIPAAAGYYGLWRAPVECGYGRSPVTAWQIDIDEGRVAWIHPVVEGMAYNDVAAILCPDGTVNQSDGGEFWPSIEEWLAHINPAKPRKPVEPKSKPSGDPWYKA